VSAGTVTFRTPRKTLLERLRHDLLCHKAEYHHVTPADLFTELDAAIVEERLAEAAELRMIRALKDISNSTNPEYTIRRAREGLGL
jgi:hypothetical protein